MTPCTGKRSGSVMRGGRSCVVRYRGGRGSRCRRLRKRFDGVCACVSRRRPRAGLLVSRRPPAALFAGGLVGALRRPVTDGLLVHAVVALFVVDEPFFGAVVGAMRVFRALKLAPAFFFPIAIATFAELRSEVEKKFARGYRPRRARDKRDCDAEMPPSEEVAMVEEKRPTRAGALRAPRAGRRGACRGGL